MKQLRQVFVIFIVLALITGAFYPLVITGIGQICFPRQANGSMIIKEGTVVGSELIGQQFSNPAYFRGRRSVTADFPYNASSSCGSNQAASNPALYEAVRQRVTELRSADSSQTDPVPVDLATASGSGLDPDITPAAALYQVNRVAAARGIPVGDLVALVNKQTKGRQFGLFGEPRVNVLQLNLMLDQLYPITKGGTKHDG